MFQRVPILGRSYCAIAASPRNTTVSSAPVDASQEVIDQLVRVSRDCYSRNGCKCDRGRLREAHATNETPTSRVFEASIRTRSNCAI